jgi:hypothetical protein
VILWLSRLAELKSGYEFKADDAYHADRECQQDIAGELTLCRVTSIDSANEEQVP